MLRLVALVILGFVMLWWARLLTHAKVPPPEGRWREITDEELTAAQ